MGKYYQTFKTGQSAETKPRRFMMLKIGILIVLVVVGAVLLAYHQSQLSGWQNALGGALR